MQIEQDSVEPTSKCLSSSLDCNAEMAGEQCLLLHPFSTTLRLLLLVVSLSVTRGLSVQPTRVNNPCAGGSPAGPVYPVQGPARVLLTSQVMQSYFIVTQAINYVDSLLRDYNELNRVTGSIGNDHCQPSRPCDSNYIPGTLSQVTCVRRMYERLATDVMTVEKIYQAELEYETIVNTSLSYQMNTLKETLYTLLCDLQNVLERKRVQLPPMVFHTTRQTFIRNLKRFQRDYSALICIRASLMQTKDDFGRLERVGFFV